MVDCSTGVVAWWHLLESEPAEVKVLPTEVLWCGFFRRIFLQHNHKRVPSWQYDNYKEKDFQENEERSRESTWQHDGLNFRCCCEERESKIRGKICCLKLCLHTGTRAVFSVSHIRGGGVHDDDNNKDGRVSHTGRSAVSPAVKTLVSAERLFFGNCFSCLIDKAGWNFCSKTLHMKLRVSWHPSVYVICIPVATQRCKGPWNQDSLKVWTHLFSSRCIFCKTFETYTAKCIYFTPLFVKA